MSCFLTFKESTVNHELMQKSYGNEKMFRTEQTARCIVLFGRKNYQKWSVFPKLIYNLNVTIQELGT